MNTAKQYNMEDYSIAMGTGNIFQTILEDYEKLGMVGEDHNKLMCYLAATTRLMEKPLNILVLSSSGAGKSTLQDKTLKLMPPEDVIRTSAISDKALFYQKSLKGKNPGSGRGSRDERYVCHTDTYFGRIFDAGIGFRLSERQSLC